jgi:hypothetical protein
MKHNMLLFIILLIVVLFLIIYKNIFLILEGYTYIPHIIYDPTRLFSYNRFFLKKKLSECTKSCDDDLGCTGFFSNIPINTGNLRKGTCLFYNNLNKDEIKFMTHNVGAYLYIK